MTEQTNAEKTIWSQIWPYIMIAITVYTLIHYIGRPYPESFAISFEEIFLIVLAFAGGAIFILVSRKFNWLNTRSGQIMFLIAIGLMLWAIAEATWMGYELAGLEPFPSLADVFYIGAYIPIALALILNISTIKVRFSRLLFILWVSITALGLAIVLWLEVVPFLLELPTFETVIVVIYPLEDILLISLALVIFLKFKAGEVAKPWLILLSGFVIEAIGDILFSYADWYETYTEAYHVSDLFFTLGYIAMLAGGLYFLWLYRSKK